MDPENDISHNGPYYIPEEEYTTFTLSVLKISGENVTTNAAYIDAIERVVSASPKFYTILMSKR